MIVQNETWANVSLLHIYKTDMKKDAPIAIFLHGFMSGKEHNLHYAYNLVKQGVRVLLPDALYHGGRAEGLNEAQLNMAFWQIVFQNIKEVGVLHEELEMRGFTGKVAVAGTSMGGISTAGCLMKYDWIETAAILMGAVSFPKLFAWQMAGLEKAGVKLPVSEEELAWLNNELEKYDGFKKHSAFERVPLLFWHGKQDPTVPFVMSHDFYEAQKAASRASNIEFLADARAGHAVSRAGVLKTAHFLAQHLA